MKTRIENVISEMRKIGNEGGKKKIPIWWYQKMEIKNMLEGTEIYIKDDLLK